MPAPLDTAKAALAFFGLGGLVAFLIIGETLSPGFTGYWGYLTGQVTLVICVAVVFEVVFGRQGGFSRATYVVAIAALWGDVLGNAAGFYDSFDEYDKITHFFGIAAVTSGMYDVLRCLYAQGRIRQPATTRMWLSVCFGLAVGVGWEFYEFVTDVLFRTDRVYGAWDTFNDIISDGLGALAAGLLLRTLEQQATEAEFAPVGERSE